MQTSLLCLKTSKPDPPQPCSTVCHLSSFTQPQHCWRGRAVPACCLPPALLLIFHSILAVCLLSPLVFCCLFSLNDESCVGSVLLPRCAMLCEQDYKHQSPPIMPWVGTLLWCSEHVLRCFAASIPHRVIPCSRSLLLQSSCFVFAPGGIWSGG